MGIQHYVNDQIMDHAINPFTEEQIHSARMYVTQIAIKQGFVEELKTILEMLGVANED